MTQKHSQDLASNSGHSFDVNLNVLNLRKSIDSWISTSKVLVSTKLKFSNSCPIKLIIKHETQQLYIVYLYMKVIRNLSEKDETFDVQRTYEDTS